MNEVGFIYLYLGFGFHSFLKSQKEPQTLNLYNHSNLPCLFGLHPFLFLTEEKHSPEDQMRNKTAQEIFCVEILIKNW